MREILSHLRTVSTSSGLKLTCDRTSFVQQVWSQCQSSRVQLVAETGLDTTFRQWMVASKEHLDFWEICFLAILH